MQLVRFTLDVTPERAETAAALLGHMTHARAAIEEPHARGKSAGKALVSVYLPLNRAKAAERRIKAALARAESSLGRIRLSSKKLRDERWAESWKRFFKPSKIAHQLYVVPSWEKGFVAPPHHDVIVLDPGMAFGTGQHATTALTLALMMPRIQDGAAMIDVGCGSGILALAAARRGARVHASDDDPLAVAATRANFRKNKLKAHRIARARGIPPTFPRAALIAANISAEVLVKLAPALAAKLVKGGALVTSGYTKRTRLHVQHALAMAGLVFTEERRSGEWLAQVHER